MNRNVEKLANSKVSVVCDIDKEAWKTAQDKAFKKLATKVKVSGFREGKVPVEIAKKHISTAQVFDEAINSLLQGTYEEVIREEKLVPAARPSVDVTKISETELQLKFVIVTAPEVKLGKYKGLGIAKEVASVSEEEVKQSIDKLVENNASLVVSEEPAKMGDTVVIDFLGTVDGVPFDGGKAENYSLELGSKTFIPGFEEQLVAVKAGDEVDVKVTFPEHYGVKELENKAANFHCKVHEVKSKVLPELDEELIEELKIEGVKTVEELKEHQRSQILLQKESEAKRAMANKVVDEIVKGSSLEIADEIIDDEVAAMIENVKQQAQQYGLTYEGYLSRVGKTEESLKEEYKPVAKRNLEASFVIQEIAKQEKITVEDKDLDEEFESIAKLYNLEVAKVKEILGQNLGRMKTEIMQRKIEEFLVKENTK